MRGVLLCALLLISMIAFSQGRYDANWVFGKNAGIDFSDPLNPATFSPVCNNGEVAGSISDESGELRFYYSVQGSFLEKGTFRNSDNYLIAVNDSFDISFSATNGVLIIPIDSIYWVFHLTSAPNHPMCPTNGINCFQLRLSKFVKDIDGELLLTSSNLLLLDSLVGEQITATRNASNTGWWILVHGAFNCSNSFYKYLLTDSIELHDIQFIGSPSCSQDACSGEMKFSLTGNTLGRASWGEKVIEVYSFNRCSGILNNHQVVDNSPLGFYGLEFGSDSILYVTTIENSGPQALNSLFQYSRNSNGLIGNRITLWDTSAGTILEPGQLEIAPDGKIYLSITLGLSFNPSNGIFNKHLSVIQHPEKAGQACDFEANAFYLGDSAYTSFGLPNFPNYNLGPLPVFTATAGPDTLQCDNGLGVNLGVPPVPNVVYQWSPTTALSNPSVAQPLASPETDTWYYLAATDTTATTCAVHVDSVLVQVTRCTGIEEQAIENDLKLYPNPAKDFLYLSSLQNEPIQCTLFALDGRQVSKQQVQSGQPIDVSPLHPGLYIYLLEATGHTARGKVMIK